MRETQELFVGALFSFGGGIGGECFEEPAANLNTLREAKREDDEADCFWADAELLVVAIEDGRGGRMCRQRPVADGCCTGRALVSSNRTSTSVSKVGANTHKSQFGFVCKMWRRTKYRNVFFLVPSTSK